MSQLLPALHRKDAKRVKGLVSDGSKNESLFCGIFFCGASRGQQDYPLQIHATACPCTPSYCKYGGQTNSLAHRIDATCRQEMCTIGSRAMVLSLTLARVPPTCHVATTCIFRGNVSRHRSCQAAIKNHQKSTGAGRTRRMHCRTTLVRRLCVERWHGVWPLVC
eukprot:COSAG06_NODE_19851_length_819_cov_148.134722_1_plen_164_part_00